MVQMHSTGKLPLLEQDIQRVAKHFGVEFSAEYQQFMLATNGGILAGASSFKCQNGFQSCVGWFYSIDKGDDSDIIAANERRQYRLPKQYIAIGTDGGGDEICLDCRPGPGFGNVYYWDHNFEADQESGMLPEDADNCYFIADSFSKLLDSLFETKLPTPSEEEIGENKKRPENRGLLEEIMKKRLP